MLSLRRRAVGFKTSRCGRDSEEDDMTVAREVARSCEWWSRGKLGQ